MTEAVSDMTKRLLGLTTYPDRDSAAPSKTHLILPAPGGKLWSCCIIASKNGQTTIHLELWREVDSHGGMKGLEYGFVAWPDNIVGPCFRN